MAISAAPNNGCSCCDARAGARSAARAAAAAAPPPPPRAPLDAAAQAALAGAFATIVTTLAGPEVSARTQRETPVRAAKAMAFLTGGYELTPADVVGTGVFADDSDNEDEDAGGEDAGGESDLAGGPRPPLSGFGGCEVAVGNISFFSLCEHHLLPFFGTARVSYVPRHKVVGLSKVRAAALRWLVRRSLGFAPAPA